MHDLVPGVSRIKFEELGGDVGDQFGPGFSLGNRRLGVVLGANDARTIRVDQDEGITPFGRRDSRFGTY